MKSKKMAAEVLQSAKLSQTVPRLYLTQYILDSNHPTFEDIEKEAHELLPRVNKATIYNVLQTLEQAGIIRKVKLPNLKTVYDSNLSDHYHFLDEDTNELMDLEKNQVEIKTNLGKYKIREVDVLIKGTKK